MDPQNTPETIALRRMPRRVAPQDLSIAVSKNPRYMLSSSRLVARKKKMIAKNKGRFMEKFGNPKVLVPEKM